MRTEIAHKLGFENYVAFADVQMNRWDYDRKMIETYRKEILEKLSQSLKSCMPAKQNVISYQKPLLRICHWSIRTEMQHRKAPQTN